MSATPASSSSSGGAPEFWLLKIPNFLHDQWEGARESNQSAMSNPNPLFPKPSTAGGVLMGPPIAQVWISKPKPGQTRKMKLVVPSSTPTGPPSQPPQPPSEFNFVPKAKQTMLVFGTSVAPSAGQMAEMTKRNSVPGAKQQPTPEAYRLEGEVNILADCIPRNTPHYQAALQARLAQTMSKQRTTKPTSATDHLGITPLNSGTMVAPLKRKIEQLRNAKVEKRVRMEPEQLEQEVLRVMSQPQFTFITVTKLAHELLQPLGAISEQIKKLCLKQEDGPNRGLYTLRPEYRLATDNADESSAMDTSGMQQFRPATAPMDPFVKQEIKRER